MSNPTFSRRLVCLGRPFALFLTGFACHSALAQSLPSSDANRTARPAASSATNVRTPGLTATPAADARQLAPQQSPSPNDASDPQKRFAALSAELKRRIGNATDRVMMPLVKAESNLYGRFTYFEKPERLDPSTFASKDEVAAWRDSLKQFRGDEDLVERLYANVSDDLENALIAQHISAPMATSIKQQVVNSIPWELVQKKERLVAEFIETHGKLLNFYETNWGTWRTSARAGVPAFEDTKLAGTYQQLRDKITTSGQQIAQVYAKLQE